MGYGGSTPFSTTLVQDLPGMQDPLGRSAGVAGTLEFGQFRYIFVVCC